MAGVTAGAAVPGDGGFADAQRVELRLVVGDQVRQGGQPGLAPAGAAGAQFEGRLAGVDQAAAFGVVAGGEQVGERDAIGAGVAVPGLAVGHRELAALDQQVQVLGGGVRRQLVGKQRELLEEGGALAPGPGLAEGPAAPVEGGRGLVRRGPGREVLGGEDAGVVITAGVQGRAAGLPQKRAGYEPRTPYLPGPLDAIDPVAARGIGLGEQAPPGGGQRRVAEQGSGAREFTVRQVDLGGGRPLALEQLPHGGHGLGHPLHGRVPVLCVADGVLEHVRELLGAVVAQQHHPRVEGAGYGRRQRAGAGDQFEAEPAVVGDGRGGGGHALPAQHPHLSPGGRQQDRHLAGGAVEVGFDDVQHEAGRDRRVEGVAAVLQHGHRRLRGEPVRGRHHAEGALERGPGREHGLSPRGFRATVRTTSVQASVVIARLSDEGAEGGRSRGPRDGRGRGPADARRTGPTADSPAPRTCSHEGLRRVEPADRRDQ